MTDLDDWRSWPKVSPSRSGAANHKRYSGKRLDGTRTPERWEPDPSTDDQECAWCSSPATRLCDTMLRGRNDAGDLDLFRGLTCDAPICDGCTESNAVHFSGDAGHH